MKRILLTTGIAVLAVATIVAAQGYVFNTNLTVGSTGPDVSALQTWLIANGYSIPAISSGTANKGYFGSQTKSAVEQYQAAKGIPSTGFVGPLTRGSLNGAGSAMTTTNCPAGFTCTANVPVSVSCPVGYTCTSNTGTTGTTGTVTAPTGITTPGVSGTLSVASSGSVAIGGTVNPGQSSDIAGFKLQAGPSDMQVNTITADFNVRPWLFFTDFSLVNQTTGQVLVPPTPISSASFTEITASADYRYTLSGLNFVVPHGQTVNVVLHADTVSSTGQTAQYLNILSTQIRSVDGTGVVDTETLNGNGTCATTSPSPCGSVYFGATLKANLIASIDPNSPPAQIIQTQTGSVTNNIPLVTYDIQAQNSPATLQGLTLNVGVNGGGYTVGGVYSTIELQAGGQTYYGTITSTLTSGGATTTYGTVTFNSNVSIPLPLGQSVPLKIIANVAQGVTGVTSTTSLQTASAGIITGVDASYNTPTVQNVGTIGSATVTFSTTAAFSVVAGAAPQLTQVSYTGGATQGTYTAATWPFTFTVSAGSSPIYISATPGMSVKIGTDLAGTPGPQGTGAASSTQAVGISSPNVTGDTNGGFGTAATGSYYVPSNSSRTFTLTVIQNNAGNGTTDGAAVVGLTGVYYSSTQTAALATTATSSESLYTLPSSVNSPTVSLVSH